MPYPIIAQKLTQSGRSMIEMLGVLAIIGVLSVGALVGYSSAMATIKSQEAVDEMKGIISTIHELYADANSYEGLTTTIAQEAGIITEDGKNTFDSPIYLSGGTTHGFPVFVMAYYAPNEKSSDAMCKKMLLNPWIAELGQEIRVLDVYHYTEPTTSLRWTPADPNYALPPSPGIVEEACNGFKNFQIHIR